MAACQAWARQRSLAMWTGDEGGGSEVGAGGGRGRRGWRRGWEWERGGEFFFKKIDLGLQIISNGLDRGDWRKKIFLQSPLGYLFPI